MGAATGSPNGVATSTIVAARSRAPRAVLITSVIPGASCPSALQVAEGSRSDREDQAKRNGALVMNRSSNERDHGDQGKERSKNVSDLYGTWQLDLLILW